MRRGIRAGAPAGVATLAVGISFGVLARPAIGAFAAVAMSVLVYAGAAQFAAIGTLAAGGSAWAAVVAGLLVNARFLPMGIAAAPAFRGGRLRRGAEGQTVVDASWAIASDGQGNFDRGLLIGATIPQAIGWWAGTAIGAYGGSLLGNMQRLGLDAVFPAFFLALLVRSRRALGTAILGAAIALALVPVLPVLFGARRLPAGMARFISLLAPALLAALVAVDTFAGHPHQLVVSARVAGVAAAGAGVLLRLPIIAIVLLAAAVTALARAL